MPDFAVLIPSRFEFHVCGSAVVKQNALVARPTSSVVVLVVVERIEQLPLSGSHREICSAVRLLD